MSIIQKIFKKSRYSNTKLDSDTLRRYENILKTIDSSLAGSVRENMCVAYGFVNYGFGVDKKDGSFYVVVYSMEGTVVDEFNIDVDFLSMSKHDLFVFLSEQINNELLRIYFSRVYKA